MAGVIRKAECLFFRGVSNLGGLGHLKLLSPHSVVIHRWCGSTIVSKFVQRVLFRWGSGSKDNVGSSGERGKLSETDRGFYMLVRVCMFCMFVRMSCACLRACVCVTAYVCISVCTFERGYACVRPCVYACVHPCVSMCVCV